MSRLHATFLAAGRRARVDDVCVQPGPFPPLSPPAAPPGHGMVGAPPPCLFARGWPSAASFPV